MFDIIIIVPAGTYERMKFKRNALMSKSRMILSWVHFL